MIIYVAKFGSSILKYWHGFGMMVTGLKIIY
jgi:hypothetical protein